jgi:hypothetical protein
MSVPDIAQTITQFTADLCTTFPECEPVVATWWGATEAQQNRDLVWNHCLAVFPERFMDIVYENADIFISTAGTKATSSSEESEEMNTEFLPGIVFKDLWNAGISDATKSSIWKYLQLIAITVMGSVQNPADLEENTAKMFENVNPEDFQSKLQETMENMQHMFTSASGESSGESSASANAQAEPTDGPSASNEKPSGFNFDNFQEHMAKLMEGNIGKMAQELAEETAADLDIDLENTQDVSEVFKKLMSDPAKLMGVAKKCGEKMKQKMASGEMSESELQAEIMGLMKAMNPSGSMNGSGAAGAGMNGIKEMMSSMGLDMDTLMKQFMGGGQNKKNTRMDTTKMNAMMKREETKQRLRANLAQKQQQKDAVKEQQAAAQAQRALEYKPMTDAEIAMLNTGVVRHAKANNASNNGSNNGKKKKKK